MAGPQIIKSERNIFVDVDDTLVMHGPSACTEHVTLQVKGIGLVKLGINRPMVNLLIDEFTRGSYVVVWSRGGFQWASEVVLALGLQNYVHQIMTKPYSYFDDKEAYLWMTDRVYLTPDSKYKTNY